MGISGGGTSSSGALTYIGGTTLDVAGTTLSVSGLSLDEDQVYFFEANLIGTGAANITYTINADTTATNYYTQLVQGAGSTTSATTLNDNAIGATAATRPYFALGYIRKLLDNRISIIMDIRSYDITAPRQLRAVCTWTTSGTNLTTFNIIGSADLAIGSSLKIYKLSQS